MAGGARRRGSLVGTRALHYGSLSAAAAACGCLAALMIDERRAVWPVVALTAGAAPGVLILVVGATAFLAVMGVPLGACAVFFYALAGLLMLPFVELAMPQDPTEAPDSAWGRRTVWRWAVLLPLALSPVIGLTGAGLLVDRFDENRPAPVHLMYVLDADTGTALWASEDDAPHEWIARYVTDRRAETKIPLPYRTEPKWSGPAQAVPLEAPELTVVGSRTDGDVTVLELRLSSQRGADVLTLHADRPVQNATIATDGHQPVTSRPSYPNDARDEEWPYELRFYDPPSEGVLVTLRLTTGQHLRVALTDYTVGLEEMPGFTEPSPDVYRSTLHSSDLVIVGRTHDLSNPQTEKD